MEKIKAKVPGERVVWQFIPLHDFFSEVLQSEYITGQVYSVREGNDTLNALANEWVNDGNVRKI